MRVFRMLPAPVAAELAYRFWWSLGTPERVHPRDADVHARAVRGELEANGKRVTTYTWGDGSRVILLVHGWRSRASRFATLVRALEGPDRTIVAFDAPGNGDSPGRRTSVLDYAAAIHELHEVHGDFEAVVGHSFGVLSSFVAVAEGVGARCLAGISGMHDSASILQGFARQLELPRRVTDLLRGKVERRTFTVVDDPWARFVTRVEAPLPLLLVHDSTDRVVAPAEADHIHLGHPGPVERLDTDGLGHMRILSDPGVVARVADFVTASGTRTRSSASSRRTP